ncbi:MAG TPA: ATP-binding protein [Polyangiaceae bacterium]
MTRAGRQGPRTTGALAELHPSELFEAIADYTYDWESWIGPSGELCWVNRAVRALTGYSEADCRRMQEYPLPIVHPEDRVYMSEVLQRAARGSKGNDLEFRIVCKDGTVRWVAISWRPIQSRHRRRLGYRTSVRDIEARKRLEERLRIAKREADAAGRAKAEFLAVASHELRTPIHAIRGYTQLLLTRQDGLRDPECLRTILQESDELLRVVDGILAYAAYDSHELRPARARFDLRTLLAQTLQTVSARARVKGLPLSLSVDDDVPEHVLGDAVRLRQVLGNLLENAVKFTSAGAVDVIVSRSAANDTGQDRITFMVRDTGIGIPERGVARLFDPFVQGTASASRAYGGTGLGLAIVRRLCAQMGGEIRARRRSEGGSVFEAVLPLPAVDPTRSQETPRTVQGSALDSQLAARLPLDVLVVDDSRAVRELTVEQLRLFGYAPDAAADGRAAIRLAEAKAYDLVLLDVQMPHMDGVTAARALRSLMRPGERPATIVALSADLFAEKHALKDGSDFDAFIAKPVGLDGLQRFLEELGTSRLARAAVGSAGAPRAVLEQNVIADLLQYRGSDGQPLLLRASQPLLEQSGALLQELALLLDTGESARAARLSHRLKGDCSLVGAWRAAELAGEISMAGERGLVFQASELLHALGSALDEAREALRRLLASAVSTHDA